MEHYIIVTEGSQDVSVIHNLLLLNNFEEIQNTKDLSEYSKIFEKLLPKKFPFINEKFLVFNIIPSFYKSNNKIILLINPRGEKGILKRIDEYISSLELNELEFIKKIIVFLDADNHSKEDKINIFLDPNREIKKCDINIFLENPNKIVVIPDEMIIDFSIFVLPEDNSCGTLEKVLIETIQIVNSDLHTKVKNFFTDKKIEFLDDVSETKALISCVGAILVPKGYSTAANIKHDNIKWISSETLQTNCLNKINNFLINELNLSS